MLCGHKGNEVLTPQWGPALLNFNFNYFKFVPRQSTPSSNGYWPIARICHFEESLDLKIIWIDVLANDSILSFQNQWPYKCCIRCTLCDECILYNTVRYLGASSRLFLMQTRLSPQMVDRAMGEWGVVVSLEVQSHMTHILQIQKVFSLSKCTMGTINIIRTSSQFAT